MRKKLLLLLMLFVYAFSAFSANYYVSPSGNNNNTGTLASPFQTIQKASSVALSGDFVYVRAGVYREQVEIFSNGVVYQPYNGEVVTINGTDIMLSWSLLSGSTYQSAMNWDVNTFGTNQIFSDGKMIELARWPDQTSTDIIMPTNAIAESVTASGTNFIINDLQFNEPSSRWVGAKIWVNLARAGYDGQGWTGRVLSISGNNITVNFQNEAPRLGNEPWSVGVGTEYFLFDPTLSGVNASGGVNALLSNGEWWKTGTTLYVKTPNGVAPNSTGSGANIIEAKRRHFAFFPFVSNKSNYTIKGFNLFGCSITTDINALTNRSIAEDAQNITIDGINAIYPSHQTDCSGNWQDQNYGWSGIVLSGRNNTIKNSTLQYAASSALSIQGANNKVLNNTIRDANYICSNSGAFNTGFICLDAEIANNTIFNTTLMGINFRYAQNSNINARDVCRIHHNTIYDFMRRSGDSGAIDMFGQDGQWIRIDHNTIYTTKPVVGSMVHGIYLDYGGGPNNDEGKYTVDHNVIYNLPAPILLNNLKDVNIYNNVLLAMGGAPRPIEGAAIGTNVKIYNNIMSQNLNIRADNLINADFKSNIFNAFGPNLNNIFVNAGAGNYNLKSTAVNAINAGVSVGVYNDPLNGLPDIGAFESAFTSTPPVPPTILRVTSSGVSDWGEPAANAADGNSFTKWSQPGTTGWWKIQYGSSIAMNTYSIISTNDENGLRDLKSWTIQGSNNGTDWTTLDTQTNQTWTGITTMKEYTFTNTTPYSYYQLVFTANNGSGYTQVAEITFSVNTPADTQAPTVPTNLSSANITQNSFTLNWAASTDNVAVTGYEVFRDGVSVGISATTSMTVNALTCNTSSIFTVRARDGSGNVSAASAGLSVITASCSNPCATLLPLSSTADDYASGTIVKQANASTGAIVATNKVTNTANVTYQAGKSITLNPGFRADAGTVFKVQLGGCN